MKTIASPWRISCGSYPSTKLIAIPGESVKPGKPLKKKSKFDRFKCLRVRLWVSDIGMWILFGVSVNTPATVFPQELLLGLICALAHPFSAVWHIEKVGAEKDMGGKNTEKREQPLILRELICSGLDGFACLPVIVVCSLSISAPGNYWLVLIGKLLISCSLALFN